MAEEKTTTIATFVDAGMSTRQPVLAAKHEKPYPSDVFDITPKRLMPHRYPAPDSYRMRPSWTVEQATWIALDIDPWFVTPTWRIQRGNEHEIRELAYIVTDELRARVGEQGCPDQYIKAIAELGIESSKLQKWISSSVFVDKPKKPRPIPRDSTLVATIAALLAEWPGGRKSWPTSKDLERSAESAGIKISDDSIRKALDLAKGLLPDPPK